MVRTQVFDSNIGRSFAVIIDRKKPLSELLNKKELNKIWKIFFFLHYRKINLQHFPVTKMKVKVKGSQLSPTL